MDGYAILATLVLLVAYSFLLFSFVRQLSKAFAERFQYHKRTGLVCLMAAVLAITAWKPEGLVNFKAFEPRNVLVAGVAGAANCQTTISLRTDHTFIERVICFGVREIRGRFEVRNDTVFFKGSTPSRGDGEYYKYAVIKKSIFRFGKNDMDLVSYMGKDDTSGRHLVIVEKKLPID